VTSYLKFSHLDEEAAVVQYDRCKTISTSSVIMVDEKQKQMMMVVMMMRSRALFVMVRAGTACREMKMTKV